MTDRIEIPRAFPDPGVVAGKRVVITGSSLAPDASAFATRTVLSVDGGYLLV
jgi:hypothetical protein